MLILVGKYHEDIITSKTAILAAQELFSGGNIWPDQCERVINSLNIMGEPVQKLYRLLDMPAHLPMAIGPLRYPLVRVLHQVDNLVNELTILITEFGPLSRSSSRQAVTNRQDIERKLEQLVQSLDEESNSFDKLISMPQNKNKLAQLPEEPVSTEALKAKEYEVASLRRQLANLEHNLLTLEEKMTTYIDPRNVHPDWEEAAELIRKKITNVQLRLVELEATD